MKSSAYKSLPKREKLLLLIGSVLDEQDVQEVLSYDARHGKAFKEILESFASYPEPMRKLVLLSYIKNEVND